MTVGLLAAVAVGEWSAALVAFFLRVCDYTEKVTTERACRADKDLSRSRRRRRG